ncbi:glycosyltransferase family 4 protein [Pseudonocardia broussonetiae]|uniref:Glycosyltransferase n=1 Tax=Pseudonocardia broussonetiae TaxID=2736640 RepID=A0A6M6JP86_9PSEU|nr:glycosyltransferase [Pseudonocardia broussonetiae]QJY49043.1 glycosyltransferase [Pseudonocardia broussonetiae]
MTADRRRVLLFTSHPIDARDGADKELSVAIASGLPEFRFTWFGRVGGRGREPLSGGRRIPLLSPSGMPGRAERAQAAAWALALEPRSDLLHAVMTIGPAFGAFTRIRERVLGGRRRPALHTVPAVEDPARLAGVTPLGTTVALSRSTEQMLCDAGFPDVRLIPPGIDLDRWSARPRPAGRLPVVAFAGHYDPGGGVDESVAALGSVASSGRPLSALFLMRPRPGQDEDREAERLRERARAAGITDVVVQGRTPDMPAAVAGVDVLLLPARHLHGKADVPLTVLEAMATGRPVVVSDLPQMAALGSAATRVPAGDVAALAGAVLDLLDGPGRWDAMAQAGLDLVRREFSADGMTARYAALYEELLAPRAASGATEAR